MAAPNMLSPSSIYPKTTGLILNSTSETNILVNAASSNKTIRVQSLYAANIDGSTAADISLKWYDSATTGSGYAIANTISVPADATVVLLAADSYIWLEEDRRLTVQASASGDISVVCSYEETT